LLVLGALASWPPASLDVPALYGQSPTTVEAALGAPQDTWFETLEGSPEVRGDVFAVTVGGNAGELGVTYCGGQAYAFELALASGPGTAEGLLALVGVDESEMEVVGASELSASWREESEHMLASSLDGEWVRLQVRYDAPGC